MKPQLAYGQIDLKVRCKAFPAEGVRHHIVRVDLGKHPRVRVWDSAGELFTVIHALSPRTERQIIAAARKLAPRCAGCGRHPSECWIMPCLELEIVLQTNDAREVNKWCKVSGAPFHVEVKS